MKHWEKELPAGYREAKVIDAKADKKLVRGMTAASFVVLLVFLAFAILWQGRRLSSEPMPLQQALVFWVALIAYIVLHELVHGAAYKLLTGQKLTFGITLTVAFCGVPEIYVYRRASLIAVLAPFVVFTVLGVVLLAVFPGAWTRFFLLIFLGLHIGGCSGDLYNTWLYLTRVKDPRTLTRDTGPVQTFYVPED